MATLAELEKRIQALEDLEAIKRLKADYARACDTTDVELMRKTFTEDAIWDGGQWYGKYKIGDFLAALAPNAAKMGTMVHYFTNPTIVVEGNKAYGRWLMLRSSTAVATRYTPNITVEKEAKWLIGWEDDKYVKVNGRWRQSEMKLTIVWDLQHPYKEPTTA